MEDALLAGLALKLAERPTAVLDDDAAELLRHLAHSCNLDIAPDAEAEEVLRALMPLLQDRSAEFALGR